MIIKKILSFLFIFASLNYLLQAQVSYGLQIQNFGRHGGGGGQLDSITVITNSNAQLLEYSPQGIGMFFEYGLKSKLPLSIRAELNYRIGEPLGLQLFLFNSVTGRISLSNYSEIKQGYNIELPLDFTYTFFKRNILVLNHSVGFEIGLLAGISFQIQSKDSQLIYQKQPINSQGLVDVNSAINNSLRMTNYFYNYGLRLRLWNFVITYRIDQLLYNSISRNLNVWGTTYPFKVSYEYQSITVGYILDFKQKK